MVAPSVDNELERNVRKIETLKPYPRQHAVFDALPPNELQELAASIASLGLQHPIHILPDDTIVGGHNRVRAVQLLGWEEIPVKVRHDLVGKSDAELDQIFIEDNLNRRQMDAIQIARAYAALKGKSLPRDRASHRGDLRDQLAKRFGKSGRMLDRYVRLLQLPRALQTAVSHKDLTLAQAESLLNLSGDEINELAANYEAGKPIRSLLPRPVVGSPGDVLTGMVTRPFHAKLRQLIIGQQMQPNAGWLTKSQANALREIRHLIDQLCPGEPGQTVRTE